MSRKQTGWSWSGHRPPGARSWLQIAVLIVIAVTVFIATWQFSEAGGLWQDAVREDVRRSAALQEDVRYAYADEAALGFRVAAAEARADGLRALKNTSRLAASEYTIATQTAFALRQASPPDNLIGGVSYVRGELGYDMVRRLVDIRARHPDLRDLTLTRHRPALTGTRSREPLRPAPESLSLSSPSLLRASARRSQGGGLATRCQPPVPTLTSSRSQCWWSAAFVT
ncbi:MAG: hypothetical protein ACRDRU_07210 [Pseudonocardiaceae bacterium]